MNPSNPYEYYHDKLGVKIKFLISDRNKEEESLHLITYRALKWRMESETSQEKQLRRGSLGVDALIEYKTIEQEWKELLSLHFGNPPEKIRENFFAKHYFTDGEAYSFFRSYRYGDRNEKVLTDEQVELYTNNVSVLNTCITLKGNRSAMKKALNSKTIDVWESLSRDVAGFTSVKHNLPSHKDRLRRKVMQYQKEGYSCLISGKLQNKNATKVETDEQTNSSLILYA